MSEVEIYSPDDEAHEQLVAYLDGELDAEASRQVEQHLAENAAYRRELQQLQRAWDLLDELPRAEVGEAFTQTTVEMVALSAAQELTDFQGQNRRRQRVLWGGAGAGVVIAALASYLSLSAYFARPNDQLTRDLPVIDRIDHYEVAGSVEFLRQLEMAGLFDDETEVPLEPRAERLDQMSDAERTVLWHKKDRFDKLLPEEQTRLRQLDQQLSQDAQQAALQQVLGRYHDWLRTLTPPASAEVLSLPADSRIARITELTRQQDERRFRLMAGGFMMSPQDLTVILEWFDNFIAVHTSEILATLPDQPFAQLKKEYDRERDRNLMRFLYIRSTSSELPRPSQEDEAELQAKVSKKAQDVLVRAGEHERSQIIRRWVGAAVLSQMRTNPSVEELQKFAQESLSPDERSRLESLPRDHMYRELRGLYNQPRLARDPSRGFPWGFGGGGRRPGPEGARGFEGPPPGGPGFPSPWEFPGPPRSEPSGRRDPPPRDAPESPEPAPPKDQPGR